MRRTNLHKRLKAPTPSFNGLLLPLSKLVTVAVPLLMVSSIDTLAQDPRMNGMGSEDQESIVRAAWKRLYASDQSNRGEDNDSLKDVENLEKAVRLVRTYGYPSAPDKAKWAAAPVLVWIHNDNICKMKNAFPMLYEGYKNGTIGSDEFLNYILRSYFYRVYGRHPHKLEATTTSIENQIDKLNLPRTFPDAETLDLVCHGEKPLFQEDEDAVTFGYWYRDKEIYYFEGLKGVHVELCLVKINNSYYYREFTKNYPVQALELTSESDSIMRFRFSNDYQGEYLELKKDGSLSLYAENGEMLISYVTK